MELGNENLQFTDTQWRHHFYSVGELRRGWIMRI